MQSLEVKRKVIQHHMDNGLYPYTKRYLGTLRNHFSTIGLNGLHEMLRNFTDDREGMHTAARASTWPCICSIMCAPRWCAFRKKPVTCTTLRPRRLRAPPTAFAKEDFKRYPDILQAGCSGRRRTTPTPRNCRSAYTDDPFEALELQDELQCKYTGGTVLHLYMAERISSTEACKNLVRNALSRFRLPYLTVTPTFSICPVHGYLAGEHEFCPQCDQVLLQRQQACSESCA